MIRGERFELDLDGDDEQNVSQNSTSQRGAFVGDILERKTASAVPPKAPAVKSHGGFPRHQKRNVASRSKQSKAQEAQAQPSTEDPTTSQDEGEDRNSKAGTTWEEEEKQRIDLENRQKLAQMSTEEIEAERQELMNSLSPALLQRLLQRSTIDSGASEEDLSQTSKVGRTQPSTKTVSFAEPMRDEPSAAQTVPSQKSQNDDLEAPMAEPLAEESIHFPHPPQPPDLDPSSATFLTDLHTKYFPSLPSDPSKLEWMQSSPSSNQKYDAAASTLQAKDLRFSFKGELIPPKVAAEIPVTEGLHHHGDAPDAAGYTIPELAHLAQSSVPAQRCIAFQTLGRILYRLGLGEFGNEGESTELIDTAETVESTDGDIASVEHTFGDLARGLWAVVEEQKVIEILMMEAEGNGVDRGRHLSAKAYAMEAVWLWRKGGGRRWKAT